MLVTLKDIGVTLVLCFGDLSCVQHIIAHIAEHLELLNLGQCCTFTALTDRLDNGGFEHNENR